jgi:hypothetical protein
MMQRERFWGWFASEDEANGREFVAILRSNDSLI